jgi:hypothetical protein
MGLAKLYKRGGWLYKRKAVIGDRLMNDGLR